MNLGAYEQPTLYTHHKIVKVVDGDGLIVCNMTNGQEFEIRMLGIDAPEVKKCKKLVQDERETHLPGQLLMELGQGSFRYLLSIAPREAIISFVTETSSTLDPYGRTLAYVFTNDSICLNEVMLKEGLAKPYDKHFCSMLQYYKHLNTLARSKKKGHYSRVKKF